MTLAQEMDLLDMPSAIDIDEPYLSQVLAERDVVDNLTMFLHDAAQSHIPDFSVGLSFEGFVADDENEPTFIFISDSRSGDAVVIRGTLVVTLGQPLGGCQNIPVLEDHRFDLIFTYYEGSDTLEYEVDHSDDRKDFFPKEYSV